MLEMSAQERIKQEEKIRTVVAEAQLQSKMEFAKLESTKLEWEQEKVKQAEEIRMQKESLKSLQVGVRSLLLL